MGDARDFGGWSFDPGEYCDRCRLWFLDHGAPLPALERYGLRPEDPEAAVAAALFEKPRFWESRLDSGLGEIFQTFLEEHGELAEKLTDPDRRRRLAEEAEGLEEEADGPALEDSPSGALPAPLEDSTSPPFLFAPPPPPPAPLPAPSAPPPPPPLSVEESAAVPSASPPPPPLPPPPSEEPDVVIPAKVPAFLEGETSSRAALPECAVPDAPEDLVAGEDPASGEAIEAEAILVPPPPPPLEIVPPPPEVVPPLPEVAPPPPEVAPPPPEVAPPPPEPFAERPLGNLEVSYDGDRVQLCWSEENGAVRLVREILVGDPSASAELFFDEGLSETRDSGLDPGSVVLYRLQRQKDGEVSPHDLLSDPLVIWRPLTDAEARPGDSEIRVSWTAPAGSARVDVDVERPGVDGTEVVSFEAAVSPLYDRDLVNGQRYTYEIRPLYATAEGELRCFDRVRRFARPAPPPPLPGELDLSYGKLKSPDAPRVATLEFPEPQTGDVRIYVARLEPEWPPGTAIRERDLARLEGPLPTWDTGRPGVGGARHETRRFGVSYYLPVAELGLHRVVGESVLGFDCEAFRRIEVEPGDDESEVLVSWEWPQGSDRVLLLWRHDEPPSGADDPRAGSRVVPLGEFMKRRRQVAVAMAEGEEKIHFLLLAGIPYTYQGREDVFFVPRKGKTSRLTWRPGGRMTLRYSIELRQGYSATSPPESAHLTLHLSPPYRVLPALVLLSNAQRRPLGSEIDDPALVALEIPADPNPRPLLRLPIPLDRVGTGYKYNLVFRDRSNYEDWKIERKD